MKPDVIVTNPLHVDFPIFRYQIRKYRNLFNKVILIFQNFCIPSHNYINFISNTMKKDNVSCFLIPSKSPKIQDWRSYAVNFALTKCNSSHILFLEQDFLIYNENMLETLINTEDNICFIEGAERKEDIIGDNQRFHPAFLLLSKKIINRTSKDFATGIGYDHFGKIAQDIKQLGEKILRLEELDFYTPNDWKHLAGLVHNHTLLINNNFNIVRPKDYITYTEQCLNLNIEQDQRWVQFMKKSLQVLQVHNE